MVPIRHNHPVKIAWDFLILVTVLVFTFLITYRMIFHAFRADGLYYALNALFLIDLLLGFVTQIKKGHHRLTRFSEIRHAYLRSWFVVDLLAFFPFELIPVVVFGGVPASPWGFHLYLALQSLTLIKLVKAVRLFRELAEALGWSPAVRRLVSFGYWFSQAVHLMALGWLLLGAGESGRPPFDQYLRALYWVTTSIATIGYGDYIPDHNNNGQILYTIVVQIFGVGMYTFIIANVSSLISTLDVARAEYHRHLETVNAYLRSSKTPPDLQERVRDYYSYVWEQKRSISPGAVVEDLPPSLSLEILMHQNRSLIESLEVFQGSDELLVREAVQRLRPLVFVPDEWIVRQGELGECMFFLTSGSVRVEVEGHQVARLEPGSTFGETALVTEERRNASIQSVGYGTGYRLDKADFEALRRRYPEFDIRVREIVASRSRV